MDPQATWDQLLAALAEGDWDQSEELAFALANWIRKGGFPPTVLGIAGLSPDFERALAMAACEFVFRSVVDRTQVVQVIAAKELT